MNEPEQRYFGSGFDTAAEKWILVVEDDPAIQEYYSQLLTTANQPFDLVKNGEWGWDCVRSKNYVLIVTDHDMPRLTGLGLIQRLDFSEYRIPVILISGTIPMNDSRLVGRCLFATIPKPASAEVLLSAIAQVLSFKLPFWFTHPFRDQSTDSTDNGSSSARERKGKKGYEATVEAQE